MQSKLEKMGIEERKNETLKSDYNADNPYSAQHPNAQSDGDALGRGTNSGGHGCFLPNPNAASSTINYSNFNTEIGGNKYDIEGRNDIGGRNKAISSSLYNSEHPYGPNLFDTDLTLK